MKEGGRIKLSLLRKETSEGSFPYVDMGSEVHGETSFRLWVNRCFVQRDEEGKEIFELPLERATIFKTEKGSLVLRQGEGTVFYVLVPCGYRGGSEFEVLEPQDAQIFPFKRYRSQQGNLGISNGALVSVNKGAVPLKIRWKRTGRLYGDPDHGITIFHPDGHEEELEGVPDGLEAIEELKGLL